MGTVSTKARLPPWPITLSPGKVRGMRLATRSATPVFRRTMFGAAAGKTGGFSRATVGT